MVEASYPEMLRRMREAIRFLWRGRSFVVECDGVSPEEARRRIDAHIDASEPDLFRLRPHWQGKPTGLSFELRHVYLLNDPVLVQVTIEPIDAGCRLTARLETPLRFRAVLALIGAFLLVLCGVLLAQQIPAGALPLVMGALLLPLFVLAMDHNARTAEGALRTICASEKIKLGEGAYRAVRVRVEAEVEPEAALEDELPREAKKRDTWDLSEL